MTSHFPPDESFDPLLDEELNALLKDPSLWEEPSSDLGTRVAQRITNEVNLVRGSIETEQARPDRLISPTKTPGAFSRWRASKWVAAAAAAGILAATASALVNQGPAAITMALSPTDLAPGAKGSARIIATQSGLRIELDATGLPRRDGRAFYQAWLKGPNGLVPVGTFHSGEHVVLWGGVALKDYPTLTITQEEVGDQESSGKRVLMGTHAP